MNEKLTLVGEKRLREILEENKQLKEMNILQTDSLKQTYQEILKEQTADFIKKLENMWIKHPATQEHKGWNACLLELIKELEEK